jgi:hypothetical protein
MAGNTNRQNRSRKKRSINPNNPKPMRYQYTHRTPDELQNEAARLGNCLCGLLSIEELEFLSGIQVNEPQILSHETTD